MLKPLFRAALLSAIIGLTATSCKTEGCINADATNFNADADTDDGTCRFESQILFYYGESTAETLVNLGVQSLRFYVNGNLIGSQAASVYSIGTPTCESEAAVKTTVSLGGVESLSFSYYVEDDNGERIWEGTTNGIANTCVQNQLVF